MPFRLPPSPTTAAISTSRRCTPTRPPATRDSSPRAARRTAEDPAAPGLRWVLKPGASDPDKSRMAPANRLQALLDVSHKLSSTLELSEVLRAFANQATELTGATAAEISFWDHDRDQLVMLVEHLEGNDEITEEGGQTYRLADYPATRQVLETQEPIQIRVSNENDDPAERALLESRGRKTLLMLPLVTRGETIGMMEVIDDA